LRNLRKFQRIPKNPKVVIIGAPNLRKKMFAHRLSIDLRVPEVSIKNLFWNLSAAEEYYRTKEFYRKVVNFL
jgi:hypothetical protein